MYETIRPEQRYKSGSHIIWACDYHIIWCTKYRKQLLTSIIQKRLKELILEKQEDYNYVITAMEIMPEHLHLLASIEPQYSVAKIVGKIKGYTAFKLRKEFFGLKRIKTLWTPSKFIASTGGVTIEVLKEYVEGQKYKEYKVDSQLLLDL